MSLLLQYRPYLICMALLISATAVTNPANAQSEMGGILSDFLNEETRGRVRLNGVEISHNGGRFNTEQFEKALGDAFWDLSRWGYGETPEMSDLIRTNARGDEWRLRIFGWKSGYKEVAIQWAPVIIVHYGTWFQYVFFSQDIHPYLYDRVDEKMAKHKREIIEEFDDVTVTIGRNGNKIVIHAMHDYYGKTGDVTKRLTFLMKKSSGVISELMGVTNEVGEDTRKEIEAEKLTYLDQAAFMFLVDSGYENLTDIEDTEEGHWEYSTESTETSYETFNFGDRLVFSMYEELPEAASEEQQAEILKQVEEIVAKKSAKGADSMEVIRHPDANNYVWVKAHFALNGEIRGKDVAEYHKDFKYEYAKDLHKKIIGIYKGYGMDAETIVKGLKDKSLEFLTQNEYMLLADDDLEGDLESEEDAWAEEGHWVFTAGDEERNCEILNHGDRIVYWLTMEMPTEDKDIWTAISQEVQSVVSSMPADKASSMEVTRYPDYDNWILIKAVYHLDGSIKGKDINKQYRSFVYDYSEKLYGKIYEIMEGYE